MRRKGYKEREHGVKSEGERKEEEETLRRDRGERKEEREGQKRL